MNNTIFVDSNLWLYVMMSSQSGDDRRKTELAVAALRRIVIPVISTQVLAEVGCNLQKKGQRSESRIRSQLTALLEWARLVITDGRCAQLASHLRESGTWSYWDSLIAAAAALDAGCDELWSEDMQDGRIVERRMRILNPLREGA